MHSENIAAYIGLDVHKETLAVAIAAPERLGEVRYYGTINNEAGCTSIISEIAGTLRKHSFLL